MGRNIPNKCPVTQLRVQNGNLFLDLDKNKKVSKARYPQGVDGEMTTLYTRDSNKEFSSELPNGYRIWQKALEEGRRVKWPKRYEYSN